MENKIKKMVLEKQTRKHTAQTMLLSNSVHLYSDWLLDVTLMKAEQSVHQDLRLDVVESDSCVLSGWLA